jgi:predicted nucleotidyltransferase
MMPITLYAIDDYVKRLVARFNPQTVLLFGSQATGTSAADSDVDLLVVMDHDKKRDIDQEIEIDRALSRPFPLDILVRRPVELKRRMDANDMALTGMFKTGKLLYVRTQHHA